MAFNLKSGLALVGVALTLLVAVPTIAQPPGGGPPGGFGFGGGGFGGGGNSVSSTPVAVLEIGLKLTSEQKTKIADIQKQSGADRTKMMQDLRNGGQPPDQEAFQAFMKKMQDMNADTDKKITALLTAEQKKMLPDVLKEIQTLNAVGVPAATMGDLKLTETQKKKLADIAAASQKMMNEKMQEARQSGDFQSIREIMMTSRKETHDKAFALLTEDQKKVIAKYEKEHPQQPGRGFGGFGGPPPGGAPPPR